MTSTHDKIRQAASRNTELLAGLHETDSAPSQLYQQIQYLNDLGEQLKATESQVTRLKEKTKLELKDHKKYNESTFRRFAHRASGRTDRFNEKAAKEEKEYFDAIQSQKSAEDELAYIRTLLAEGNTTKTDYERAAARHDELQRELDALYNAIFAGTTPEFPDEDAREAACNAANARLQGLAQALEKDRHVLELVKKTSGRLLDAKRLLMQAHDMSTMDLWGGSTFVGMAKRNALEQADSCMQQVRMLAQQIQQIDPGRDVMGLGAVDVHIGNIWSDVVFDNIFTDMEM
jgi:predicted S18 family serine protease